MDEADWLTRKKRINTKLRSLSPHWQIIYYRDGFDFSSRRNRRNGTRLAKARGQVDALTPSLLARAFAGQLVPQDTSDEPAENFLERIKSNHEPKSQRDTK